jgi:thiamine biosynthesis lipoprotein
MMIVAAAIAAKLNPSFERILIFLAGDCQPEPKDEIFTTMRTLSFILSLFIMSLPVFAGTGIVQESSSLKRYEFTQYHMGVDVRIVLYSADQSLAERAAGAAFDRFAQLDDIMSDYRPKSELMRLCAKAGGPPVQVSKELFLAIERSQELARRTDGGFDITCSPIVKLWRKARKSRTLPPPDELAKARALVGWRNIRLDAKRRTVQLLKPGMMLDLGGIGKGYGDDGAQQVLRRYGITSALIEAGGDIVVTNPPPGKPGWVIRVANAGKPGDSPDLTFSNVAVSTSGDTEQFVEIEGKRYSHIVDPHTGLGLTDRIEVTIVAKDGLTSDGLSTAVSVVGAEKGRKLVEMYPGTSVYIKYASDYSGPHR